MFLVFKKKKIQAPAEGIRRASHLPSHISKAEFKATAGEINWRDSPFPTHLSQWKRGRAPFPLPRQEVHKGREGLLLKEATASEVVALTTGFGGASGLLFILRLFYFLKSWHMSDLQKRKISVRVKKIIIKRTQVLPRPRFSHVFKNSFHALMWLN